MYREEPEVAIILLNWNTGEETIECLESLENISYNNYNVVIVDNNSKDDSIEKIRAYAQGDLRVGSEFFDAKGRQNQKELLELSREEALDGSFGKFENARSRLTLIKNPNNEGFAEGCNTGIRYAKQMGVDYYCLLNNDTVVANDFLSELIDASQETPNSGIVGSKVLYYDQPNVIQAAGGEINWWLGGIENVLGKDEEDVGQFSDIEEREYVWATSAIIDAEVVDDIGLLDSYFFWGIEEYDYNTRAIRNGYGVYLANNSKVWHKGGASGAAISDHPDTEKKIRQRAGKWNWKFFYRLFRKHLPPVLFLVPLFIRMVLTAGYRLYKKLGLSNRDLVEDS